MTNEEIAAAVQRGENVAENMARLYDQNSGAIQRVVNELAPFAEPEDIAQECYLGLWTAARRYDPAKGESFMTYAWHWIRAAGRRYVDRVGVSFRMSAGRRRRVYKLRKAAALYEQATGHPPTRPELAEILGVPMDVLEETLIDNSYLNVASFDETFLGSSEEELTLADVVAAPGDFAQEIADRIERDELAETLWGAVDQLRPRRCEVLHQIYKDGRSRTDIAQEWGVTLQTVSATEKKALRDLRKEHTEELKPYFDSIRSRRLPEVVPDLGRGLSPEKSAVAKIAREEAWQAR